jgi:hypothetical protein
MKFYVWDQDRKRAYVDRGYETREEADEVLDDLLRYYPGGHDWRRRLAVREGEAAHPKPDTTPKRHRADVSRAVSRAVTLPDGRRAVLVLSEAQARVLDAYVSALTMRGTTPQLGEVGRLAGIASKGVVHRHLAALEAMGIAIAKNDTRFSGFSQPARSSRVRTGQVAAP